MNPFTSKTLEWWQVGIFKISLLSVGVAIGAYWSEAFLPYVTWLAVVGVVLGLYIAFVWFKK